MAVRIQVVTVRRTRCPPCDEAHSEAKRAIHKLGMSQDAEAVEANLDNARGDGIVAGLPEPFSRQEKKMLPVVVIVDREEDRELKRLIQPDAGDVFASMRHVAETMMQPA